MAQIADILVIGSGASGGAFAWRLSQRPGLQITCLEQGEWADKVDSAAEEAWQGLVSTRKRPDTTYYRNGYPYDHSESSWEPVLGHAVGGGTVHYAAAFNRLRPSDFRVHSRTGVGEDWPISYEDLASFFSQNDNHVGVTGVPGNPAHPDDRSTLLPFPAAPDTQMAALYKAWLDTLGWHYHPIERAIITVPFNGRNPKNPREAKNRADVVHWPEAIRRGVVLHSRATVREITVNSKGLADGAVYYDASGRTQRIRARLVAVACNGIGTPRLLLHSTSRRFRSGLANTSGLVGKGLMSHPMARVVAEFNEDFTAREVRALERFAGADPTVAVDEFADVQVRDGAVGGFTFTAAAYRNPTAVALGVPPESVATTIPANLDRGFRRISDRLPWGRTHHAEFRQRLTGTVTSSVIASELSDEHNRVELHRTLTDEFGTPAPKLIYRRSDNTVKLLAYAAGRVKLLMEAAGASRVEVQTATSAPGHYLGTARMGSDRNRSVVDRWGRAHDVPNLFVIDGSVFVTSGSRVPTATIQAIALRTADYIDTNRNKLSLA